MFLPITILGFWAIPFRRGRLAWLTLASLVFYSFWDVRFTLLLIVASLVDFAVAIRLRASTRPRRWLVSSIVFNLGVLAFFKYAVFAADNARSLFDLLSVPIEMPYFSIVLPVGISFYTFQTMSYTIDVYRGEVEPTRDLVKYAAFVTMFPQLVAGPIVRYRSISKELDMPVRFPAARLVALGLTLFALGLAKKVLIADTIAAEVDPLWAATGTLTTPQAWLAALGYTAQLYFDFSGYSDMAIGLGCLLGFTFPVNFRAPYQALNPSDFWRRWHISLSTFLRDYLYIPLGGNRAPGWRIRVNLLIVMGLGGLWHGASWTFVLWGLYHGLLLVAYREFAPKWDALPKLAQRGLMIFLVVVGWVMFRALNVADALNVYAAMFDPVGTLDGAAWIAVASGLLIAAAILTFAFVARPLADIPFRPSRMRAVVVSLILAMAIIWISFRESPFLYYQF